MAFFDLNVPVSSFFTPSTSKASSSGASQAKRNKKQSQQHLHPQSAQGKDQPRESAVGDNGDVLQRISKRDREELEQRVQDLQELGYSTIAYNHVVYSKLEASEHHNPFFGLPGSSTHMESSTSWPMITDPTTLMPSVSRPIFPRRTKGSRPLRQLHRLTLVLDSVSESTNSGGNGLVPATVPTLMSYDLLAVRPLTANAFSAACLTHTELKPLGSSFDIISLDLATTPRLPFFLKRQTIGKAIENGAVFEICYSGLLVNEGTNDPSGSLTSKEEDRRRSLISNIRDLLRVTNGGKGVILSSSATSVLGLRSPADVVNLAVVFGFKEQLARDALGDTCRMVLRRAESRRSWRGVAGWPRTVSHDDITEEKLAQRKSEPNQTTQPSFEGNTKGTKRKDIEDALAADRKLATETATPETRDKKIKRK